MPWIRTPKPSPADPALMEAVGAVRGAMPPEYGRPPSDRLPEPVRQDSIVLAHTLAPGVLHGFFSAYNELFSSELPLSRRDQELIAVVVSKLNDCL